MRYQEVPPISRNEARAAFRSGDEAAIRDALLRITYHDQDWQWIQDQLVRFARHRNGAIRGVAGLCFGHLARIHRALDRDVVLPVLRELAAHPETRGQAEDALSDIEIFVGSR
jgi:hypothetical protein